MEKTHEPTKPTAAAGLRVVAPRQAEQGTRLQRQRATVREYAHAGAEHVIFNIGCAAGDELLDQAAALHTAASPTLQHSVAWNNASRLEVS